MTLPPEVPRSSVVVLLIALLGVGGCGQVDAPTEGGGLPFERLYEVDLLDAPAHVTGGGSMAIRADGSLLALTPSSMRGDARILFFDGDGSYLSEIHRPGPGPQEYDRITALAFDLHDSLWVFEAGNQRIDVYGPDLERARSFRYEDAVHAAEPHPGGGVAFASRAGEGSERLLRLEWARGDRVELLFADEATRGRDATSMVALDELRATPAGDGMALARSSRYGLHHVTADGGVRGVPLAEPDWWPDSPPDPELAGWIDATPQVLSIGSAGSGEVWLQIAWTEPPPDGAAILDRMMSDPELMADPQAGADEMRRVVRGWMRNAIQRVDLESGAVVEEIRHADEPILFLGGSFGYRWSPGGPDDLVDLRLEICRVRDR